MSPIATVQALAVRLPMRAAFATSRGPVGSPASGRVLVLVRLTDEGGRSGWGEAGPIPSWSPETLESVLGAIGELTAKALDVPTQLYDPSVHYEKVRNKWWGTGIDETYDKPPQAN